MTLPVNAQAVNELILGGVTYTPGTHAFNNAAFIWAYPTFSQDATINVNTSLTGGGIGTVYIAAYDGSATANIATGVTVPGATGVWLQSWRGDITTVNNGTVTGGYGVRQWSSISGNLDLSGTGSIAATTTGAYLTAATGNVAINGHSSITGNSWGIYAETGGTANIGTTSRLGAVSGSSGIYVGQYYNPTTNGMLNLNVSSVTGDSGYGIYTLGRDQATNISATGRVAGTTDAIVSTSSDGNISVLGGGTGVLDGGIYGARYITTGGITTTSNFASVTGGTTGVYSTNGTGAVNVSNNGVITGTSGWGVYATTTSGAITIDNNAAVIGGGTGVSAISSSGAINVNGNGAITGTDYWGFYASTRGAGDINIGNSAFNGVITGQTLGIEARQYGTGDINISTNADVTGTNNWGALAWSTNGNTNVNVTAGNITGGVIGLDARAFGSGNVNTTIAGSSIIQGGTTGYYTGTISGTSTTNTAGLIRSEGDTGAAGTAGGSAIVIVAGTNVINNTGQVIGRQASAGLAYTFNNTSTGVWTPGTGANTFANVRDTVNNAGLINVRTGTTSFNGLENLNNLAGGNINLAYGGAAATDNLITLGFRPQIGSSVTLNFNATAANNAALGFDNSANGLGTADTIVVAGAATPQARSTINLISQGTPTSLTGSVALIYTGVNLVAPTAGANLTQSANYEFGAGSNPSSGRTVYFLVDDGNGGVYLQWKPNASAAAMAGFGGAFGKAAGGGGGAGAAITSASGGSAGVGGVGLGGGPTGGGAAGQVADLAAGSSTGCSKARSILGWGALEGERTRFSGGGGQSSSLTGGVDFETSAPLQMGCGNRLGFGFFGASGHSGSHGESGTSNGDSTGVGAYVRATSVTGLYASLLGSVGWSDTKLTNAVIGSTADKNAKSQTGAAAIGYVARLNKATTLDLRSFASISRNKADPFADTAGISISESTDNIFTYGGSIGLQQMLTSHVQGFVRAGIKKSELDSSITVFGNNLTGSTTGVASSIEAGFVGKLGEQMQIGVSGYGTRSEGVTGYGGRAHLGIKF